MSNPDIENVLRLKLRRAIDPVVPNSDAQARVMRAVAGVASGSELPPEQHSRRRQRLGAVLVAAVVVVLVGGALGIGLGLRNRATPGGVQPGTAGHPIVSSPASPSPQVTTCDGGSLQVRFADQVGAAGTEGGDIVLHNGGTATCTMEGYMSLQGLDNAQPVHIDVTHTGQGTLLNNNNGHLPPVQLITLEPGHDAYVAIQYSVVNRGPSPCASVTALLVTPPNSTRYATMAAPSPLTLCGGLDEAPVSAHPYFAQ
jgi:Protein of unknown function (DUF4232)